MFMKILKLPNLNRRINWAIQLNKRTKCYKLSANNSTPFCDRHIGPSKEDVRFMLDYCGFQNMDDFIKKTIPNELLLNKELNLPDELSEYELIEKLKIMMNKNETWRTYIGQGYYGSITPSVIQRNVFENPGWYTSYTPYQTEISQGRLEALFNFQTMISELTGLPLTNASLLDEGTAGAEALTMAFRKTKKNKFLVHDKFHPQTINVLFTRVNGLGLDIQLFTNEMMNDLEYLLGSNEYAGVLIQSPDTEGNLCLDKIITLKNLNKSIDTQLIVATDLLALTLVKSPGDMGADIVFGSSQRFGIPMGFGGPHAAFIAANDSYKRLIPGRIVGLSRDSKGDPAFRLALQTREQHIKREKATSNICTAQALLANMASFYAIYHGPKGLYNIASNIHRNTVILATSLEQAGHEIRNKGVLFDTLKVRPKNGIDEIRERANEKKINFLYYENDDCIGISLDETTFPKDIEDILHIFNANLCELKNDDNKWSIFRYPEITRDLNFMKQAVFNSFHSETSLLRYMKSLENKDVSLVHSAIPLGSCTLKLNATTELIACSWDTVSKIHPFVNRDQVRGYLELIGQLENYLKEITGYDNVCLSPNSGSQGEYAGLKAIMGYLESIGEKHRNVCLIPTSAHGTNPASAYLAGMQIISIRTNKKGSLDQEHLKETICENKDNLATIMITYPSTFGIFDNNVMDVCEMVHNAGGQVYLDGANMNAQVGLCRLTDIGADVSHLNLHKTFGIPHGGGGPGVGPVCVKAHLAPFLPKHVHGSTTVNYPLTHINNDKDGGTRKFSVCSAPFGSASLLPISWSYIRLLGSKGLRYASQIALLNSNYMMNRLKSYYPIKFVNENGMCAHEFILDCSKFSQHNIDVSDIAKRLMDYGFHSPTMSWPVPSSLMIEPTESESLTECDRLCEALIRIREEIDKVINGKYDLKCNPLKLSPHTIKDLFDTEWNRPYSKKEAFYPAPWHSINNTIMQSSKLWPTVGRLDDTFGDQNLVCTCSVNPLDHD